MAPNLHLMDELNQTIAPPIIIIGMHRSGTTLLTRMLQTCGVFWGALPDEYNESAFFQSLNQALFAMAAATWDAPEPMTQHFSRPGNREKASNFLQTRLNEGLYREYCWGLDGRSANTKDELSGHWGWKDPRNVYTLGMWLDQFPEAKVIHIIRSGIDVAISLRRRETTRPEGADHPHYSKGCQTLEGCFSLWKCYVRKSRQWAGVIERYLEIRFETLIAAPYATMERLAQFIGIRGHWQVAPAVDLIQPKSPVNHSSDLNLNRFIQHVRDDDLMKTLGYAPRR